MRPTFPPPRTALRFRDPVAELVAVIAVATLALAALIGVAAAVMSVLTPL